ncbi:MAG: class I SAM-dependent methyltransferase [Blastocatellia bacterium]|nr:class I SAM-dependent methyltransferase [Blastocatellia bacterium]
MTIVNLWSDLSHRYVTARPTYPRELFVYLASVAPGTERVLDCATGNGQAAVGLADFFQSVCAVDASSSQIEHAIAKPNISYSVRPAEQTGFPPGSFDMVCVAQALHWLDHEPFFNEVKRVLKPNGIFAAWSYNWFQISEEIDALVKDLLLDVVAPYWAPQNKLSWDGYRDVLFPFGELSPPALILAPNWTALEMMAYASTWSATKKCFDAQGSDFFEAAIPIIQSAWGGPEVRRPVVHQLALRVGRNS